MSSLQSYRPSSLSSLPTPVDQRSQSSSAGYGHPSAGYNNPSAGYGFPSAGYGFPSAGYGFPSVGYSNPQPSTSASSSSTATSLIPRNMGMSIEKRPLGATDIIDQMRTWINTDEVQSKISAAHKQKGGWEGWAQVEIAYFIDKQYDVTISREDHVYADSQQRNDFVIIDNQNKSVIYLIELKCQRQSQSADDFRNAIAQDIKKVKAKLLKREYEAGRVYVVAISATTAASKILRDANWLELCAIFKFEVKEIAASDSICLWYYILK